VYLHLNFELYNFLYKHNVEALFFNKLQNSDAIPSMSNNLKCNQHVYDIVMSILDGDIEKLKGSVEIIVIHIAKHADFRGHIKQLDKKCTICQNYFADELAKL
jgi:hypothetical protein